MRLFVVLGLLLSLCAAAQAANLRDKLASQRQRLVQRRNAIVGDHRETSGRIVPLPATIYSGTTLGVGLTTKGGMRRLSLIGRSDWTGREFMRRALSPRWRSRQLRAVDKAIEHADEALNELTLAEIHADVDSHTRAVKLADKVDAYFKK
jgi:hypothetical protein